MDRVVPIDKNILKFDVKGAFASLDPREVDSSGCIQIFPLLYSYLFVPDINGKLSPDLAKAWFYDEQELTWTIYLRDDAFFHNKQPLVAEDIKYSIDKKIKNIRPSLSSLIKQISIGTNPYYN